GRLKRVEELNWDQSVYATTDYTYNGRDQIETINQQGLTRTFEYDGHGRLSAETTPEQGRTAYGYDTDDTLPSTTDARGVVSTFAYNGRHLVTNIDYNQTLGPAFA